ncbi:MAG: hypothetical protein H7Z14_10555 [Anaerolineae bacterium]|nr:hypothetical protein [Phycisphaerae bacterium]
MGSDSWKDALLSSGLPFENDVARYLDEKECITGFESTYLRPDENKLQRQFSFDIHASYVKPPNFVTLMVECKYRHPTVKWVFIPREYGGHDELYPNTFLHTQDDFAPDTFPFGGSFPRQLAPACSKGIELTSNGPNQKSIAQAVAQLTYAFGQQVTDSIEHQVLPLLPERLLFHVVPIIATTAPLFRLKEDITLEAIRGADSLATLTTAESCVVLRHTPGVELIEHNARAFDRLYREHKKELMAAYTRSSQDVATRLSIMSQVDCPGAIVVISVAHGWDAFDRFFEYVKEVLNPSDALWGEIRAEHEKFKKITETIERAARERKAKGEVDYPGKQGG